MLGVSCGGRPGYVHYGAFFGGLVFGLLENGSYTLFALIPGEEPFALTRFFSFLILLVILLIRPTGLLSGKQT